MGVEASSGTAVAVEHNRLEAAGWRRDRLGDLISAHVAAAAESGKAEKKSDQLERTSHAA